MPQYSHNLSAATEIIYQKLGKDLRMATPLALGKPNQLLNAIYQKAKQDPSVRLTIYTALSLARPQAKSELEKRFLTPFIERHFGPGYPDLDYVLDLRENKLPANVVISEFYLQSGAWLYNSDLQRHYSSLNYTHVAQTVCNNNVNIILQMIAKRTINGEISYSLSCNPDLTSDVKDLCKKNGKDLFIVGVVHPDLPFMEWDAEVPADYFDLIVESPEVYHELFALPRVPVDAIDHAIGLHASRLVVDDGTLQIGIGSLSDALVHSIILRHQKNSLYRELIDDFSSHSPEVENPPNIFSSGIYGTSEMVMDGFMHLRKAGILNRQVKDLEENVRRYLHGAFFLGSKELYRWLKNLSEEDARGLCMTRVSKVNDLYDENEMALRRQRKNARFFNTCMQMTLLGGAASETLENGQVVSGVGGQYNFVAMAQEMPDAHSVLMLRSHRLNQGRKESNIVWSHGYLTIPRHLRDIVVTEYGIAFLKGKSDEEVIKGLIEIADSDFQEELIHTAQANGKLSPDYRLPEHAKNNTAKKVSDFILKNKALFPTYPFGSDFVTEEQELVAALSFLKDQSHNKTALLGLLLKGFFHSKHKSKAELERMKLYETSGIKDLLYQKLILAGLAETAEH